MIIDVIVLTPEGQEIVQKEVPDDYLDVDLTPAPDLQADMAELLIDLAYRTTLLELGVSE